MMINNSLLPASSSIVFYKTDLDKLLKKIHVAVTLTTMPLNVVFNGLLIAAVSIFRRLHDVQNGLIAAIAGFDMLYALVITPLYALYFSDIKTFTGNKYGCIGMYSLVLMITNGRCCFLQLFTLDRYIAILHPYWHICHVKQGNAFKYATGGIVVYIFLIGLLPMMGDEFNSYTQGNCGFFTIWPEWFDWMFYYCIEALTAVVCSILNIKIFKVVKKTQLSSMPSNKPRKSILSSNVIISSMLKHKRNIMMTYKTMLVSMWVYLAYLVFYVPICVSTIMRAIQRKRLSETPGSEEETRTYLYFNYISGMWQWGFMGVVTPVLFFYLKKDYRLAIMNLITTLCWNWTDMKHDMLGSSITTTTSTRRSSRRPASQDAERCKIRNQEPPDSTNEESGKSYISSLDRRVPQVTFQGLDNISKIKSLPPKTLVQRFLDSIKEYKYSLPGSSKSSSIDYVSSFSKAKYESEI